MTFVTQDFEGSHVAEGTRIAVAFPDLPQRAKLRTGTVQAVVDKFLPGAALPFTLLFVTWESTSHGKMPDMDSSFIRTDQYAFVVLPPKDN